jgi:hypothetical protein
MDCSTSLKKISITDSGVPKNMIIKETNILMMKMINNTRNALMPKYFPEMMSLRYTGFADRIVNVPFDRSSPKDTIVRLIDKNIIMDVNIYVRF